MLAVLNGHTECVYFLISKGANVGARDKWGRTALHRGVRYTHLTHLHKRFSYTPASPCHGHRVFLHFKKNVKNKNNESMWLLVSGPFL